MRTGTSAGVYWTMPDQNVWAQERQIITLERQSGNVAEITLTMKGNDVATYKLDNDGKCTIDITDLVRVYGLFETAISSNSLYIGMKFGNPVQATLTSYYILKKGLINPASVYKPSLPTDFFADIVPPSRMLYNGKHDLYCEAYLDNYTSWTLTGAALFVDGTNGRQIKAINPFTLSKSSAIQRCNVQSMCGIPTICVRWVSFTGITRVHVFEMHKPTIAAADNYELMTPDNSYKEIKGRKDSFTLYLDGLCAYDVWYYSDIVASSSVEVSLDGVNWTRVQVAGKNITIPDGDAINGKIELNVNWKRYDAVAM